MKHCAFLFSMIAFWASPVWLAAQNLPEPLYDESKVPQFELPALLKTQKGQTVGTVADWEKKRRPELLQLFGEHWFGHTPKGKYTTRWTQVETGEALGGKAIRKQIALTVGSAQREITVQVLMYLPKTAQPAPVPVVVGYNFFGNHSIQPDPAILLSQSWMMANDAFGVVDNRATEASRGVRAYRWPLQKILDAGFGLVTLYYGDVDPDFDDGFQNGIQPAFYKKDQKQPAPNEWGAIGAWAWGLSRVMDYLQQDTDVDSKRVAVFGHSRLGKAALWAGAQDTRFALVISNESGCGGAALSMRKYGETLLAINQRFPHWFCDNFNQYNGKEENLPIDSHQLLALIAPRPLYVGSAVGDQWSDPKGEYLGAKFASPAYELYGLKGLVSEEMPPLNTPHANGHIGYFIREGKHEVTDYDWEQYLAFMQRHLK